MRKLLSANAAALAMMAAAPAHAITYFGNRSVGDAAAQLSITTDGTLGALSAGNFVAWTITLTQGANSDVLTEANSGYSRALPGLFATATELRFNYEAAPSHGFGFLSSNSFYCITVGGVSCAGAVGESIRVNNGPIQTVLGDGEFVVATAAAVPEPASWAMMIVGFGLAGGAMRASRPKRIPVVA